MYGVTKDLSNCKSLSHDSSVGKYSISLSVHSMAQVMIAQWENECISLSVLSMARVMIAHWENECVSLCPPYGPGYDSSMGE